MNSERPHKPTTVSKPRRKSSVGLSITKGTSGGSKEPPVALKRGVGRVKAASIPGRDQHGTYAQWKEQVEWFQGRREKFLEDPRYRGKFVAIKQKRVIATDSDFWPLLERMHRKHPNEYVLVIRVAPISVHEVLMAEFV